MLRIPAKPRKFERDATIYHPDEQGGLARILVGGLAIQYRILPNGERQSADLVFPGRFCDLSCILFGKPDHFLAGVTDGEVLEVSSSSVLELFSRYPRIPVLLLEQESRDRSILFEHLLSVGRRPAVQRLAHLLTEIRIRSELAGTPPAQARSISLRLQWFGDLLGLTPVHVSRTFARLKQTGLVERHGHRYVIKDAERLAQLAVFDPHYLHAASLKGRDSRPSLA